MSTHTLRRWGEPELTSSMVSNYVKQGLISSPIKKSYTAEHLSRLLFIAVVKPVVPLEGLRMMFSIQGDNYTLPTAYDYFCDEFENMLGAAFGIAPAREDLGKTQSDAKDLLRNTIVATVNKVYLDRYLEEYQKQREKPQKKKKKKPKIFPFPLRPRNPLSLGCLPLAYLLGARSPNNIHPPPSNLARNNMKQTFPQSEFTSIQTYKLLTIKLLYSMIL